MPFLKVYGSSIRSVNWLGKGNGAVRKPTGNSFFIMPLLFAKKMMLRMQNLT